jgi:hypothetical protein
VNAAIFLRAQCRPTVALSRRGDAARSTVRRDGMRLFHQCAGGGHIVTGPAVVVFLFVHRLVSNPGETSRTKRPLVRMGREAVYGVSWYHPALPAPRGAQSQRLISMRSVRAGNGAGWSSRATWRFRAPLAGEARRSFPLVGGPRFSTRDSLMSNRRQRTCPRQRSIQIDNTGGSSHRC